MLRFAILVAVAGALAGCQTAKTPVMSRMDGRSTGSSPALAAQARQDMAVCKGEVSKALLSASDAASQTLVNDAYVGCMAGRGYVKAPDGTKAVVTPH
jgi:hypothetical protein